MLEDIRELITEIGKVKGAYLVSCFLNNKEWTIDYYSAKEHNILTYSKQNGKLQQKKDEIFQKEQKPLQELHLDKVKISYLEALDKVSVNPDKVFIILQVIDGVTVWNITVLTSEFKIYNLKVNADNGETISEEEDNIMNYKKGGPSFKINTPSG
ncbi:hypothetical protein EXS74_01410 [Candidatus Woesearchaeota archaeon]|nr:hypothetical protein [Candidatus Woesearchaeota archaeon]